jgi:lipopolysaccharide biosynthesis glycosyltransferase
MKPELNIVFTIDERFIQHFTVTLVSALENNKHLALNVFVVHDIENMKLLNEVTEFVKEKYDLDLNLMYVDNSIFAHYRVSLHYSKAVYFRLLITEILPGNIDKALFLDADVVVTGSLQELAAFEFKDDQYLLAVDDVEVESHVPRLNAMGFPVTRYFNAGVLLINVKAWRINKLSEKFISMADEYMDRLAWWDQDILNMYFYNNWQQMDPKFNALHLRKKLPVTPVIIHYAGTAKPWLYVHQHPYKSLYWDYIKLTPFKNFSYPDYNLKEVVRKYYIKLLDALKLREPAIFKEQ